MILGRERVDTPDVPGDKRLAALPESVIVVILHGLETIIVLLGQKVAKNEVVIAVHLLRVLVVWIVGSLVINFFISPLLNRRLH